MAGVLLGPRSVSTGVVGTVGLGDDAIAGATVAKWTFGGDGYTYRNNSRGYAWLVPQSGTDQFEIYADLTSGDALTDSAGLGVWISPVISPAWAYRGDAAKAGVLSVQIRRTSDLVVVDTATITLSIDGSSDSGSTPVYPPPPRGSYDSSSF